MARQRVLITGAASGLGRAMAARFAAAGARVVLADIDTAAGQAAAGELAGAEFLHLDVRDEAAWHAARDRVESEWGGLDVLVNNAGVSAAGRIEAVSAADWEWITEINLLSVVRGCRTFVPLLKEQGSGHIVNVASMAGLINPPFMGSYNVTKAGVVALSETLRFELAPWSVGVTAVCPGFVPTNLARSFRSPDPALAEVSAKLIRNGKVSPEQLAEQVYGAVRKRKFLLLVHREDRLAWWAKRYLGPVYRGQVAKAARRLRARIERAER
ncbi:SDR family oxidoreductase [Streptomyces boninensis]|uniref:SDR family oxidoreductase n=1 Tax=Streptomyces boninensis TaxID=2039455 RepID=UPI003B20C298